MSHRCADKEALPHSSSLSGQPGIYRGPKQPIATPFAVAKNFRSFIHGRRGETHHSGSLDSSQEDFHLDIADICIERFYVKLLKYTLEKL